MTAETIFWSVILGVNVYNALHFKSFFGIKEFLLFATSIFLALMSFVMILGITFVAEITRNLWGAFSILPKPLLIIIAIILILTVVLGVTLLILKAISRIFHI